MIRVREQREQHQHLRQQCDQLMEAVRSRAFSKQVVDELYKDDVANITHMEHVLLELFNDLGDTVARTAVPLLSTPEYQEKWRTDLRPDQVERLVEHIITASGLREWAGQRLTPAFWRHYERVQNTTARTLIRAGLASNLTQSTINRILDAGGRRAGLVDIIGDTRKALFRVIEQGVDAGMSPRETARLIRNIIPEGRFVNAGANYRASLIARTETLHAQRLASIERYRANRINTVIAYDGDSDPGCLMRNGMEFDITAAEDELMNTHPQCVLSFGPVVAGAGTFL